MTTGSLARLVLPAVVALLALGAAGCGSSSGSEDGDDAAARYEAYLVGSSATLVREAQALLAELEEGDRAGAQSRYVRARRSYGQVKPIAMSFSELDASIDNRPSLYLQGKFVGFHRIERTLWTGLPLTGAVPYAKRLLRNVEDLQARLSAADLQPVQIAAGAQRTADKIFSVGLMGDEEAYSHTDLVDIAANAEGMRAAFEAIEPELNPESKLSKQVESRLDDLEATMERLRTQAGLPPFNQISFIQVSRLGNQTEALGQSLSQARQQLKGASQ